MLPPQAIEEYKDLYEKRFGIVLTDEEASFRANKLLSLYRAVLTSDRKDGTDATRSNF